MDDFEGCEIVVGPLSRELLQLHVNACVSGSKDKLSKEEKEEAAATSTIRIGMYNEHALSPECKWNALGGSVKVGKYLDSSLVDYMRAPFTGIALFHANKTPNKNQLAMIPCKIKGLVEGKATAVHVDHKRLLRHLGQRHSGETVSFGVKGNYLMFNANSKKIGGGSDLRYSELGTSEEGGDDDDARTLLDGFMGNDVPLAFSAVFGVHDLKDTLEDLYLARSKDYEVLTFTVYSDGSRVALKFTVGDSKIGSTNYFSWERELKDKNTIDTRSALAASVAPPPPVVEKKKEEIRFDSAEALHSHMTCGGIDEDDEDDGSRPSKRARTDVNQLDYSGLRQTRRKIELMPKTFEMAIPTDSVLKAVGSISADLSTVHMQVIEGGGIVLLAPTSSGGMVVSVIASFIDEE